MSSLWSVTISCANCRSNSGCRQAAQVIVHFLLLCIRRGRWRHPDLLRFLFGLLQVLTMILLQHLTVAFHVLALSFLLRELAHIDFRKVALNRVVQEALVGFGECALRSIHRLRERIDSGERQCRDKGECDHPIVFHTRCPLLTAGPLRPRAAILQLERTGTEKFLFRTRSGFGFCVRFRTWRAVCLTPPRRAARAIASSKPATMPASAAY